MHSTTRVLFPGGAIDFSPIHSVQTAPGVHLSPYPMVIMSYFLGVMQPGREADHVSPSSVEIKNGGIIRPLQLKIS
jgi:hypothetical protein